MKKARKAPNLDREADRKGSVASEEQFVAEQHSRGDLDAKRGNGKFPIVGIGASAGGLEAFSQLLASVPADSGMAFILVQHLDPHHESKLSDLLSRVASIPVHEATNGVRVEPNQVYVIPPNASLAIASGILHVTPRNEGRGPHLPVDYLFRSLAEDQQGRAIAVVLSGTGSDGTLGLCEIKAIGGITFAQDENSAKHGGMPQSAVQSGCVDFVLAPADIARRLTEIGEHPYLTHEETESGRSTPDDDQFRKILSIVHSVAGVDFSMYRDSTIKRRIMRRMALDSQESWREYVQRLQTDRSEVEALYHDLLINVTSFFRDPDMFEALKTRVFPEIIKGKPPSSPIRVWVPGCSTGQEAYSIAMTLIEFFDDMPVRPPLQFFATDLSDQKALDKARAGVYPESIEAEVTPERLRRFFSREDHVYRIDKSIRDMCVFARQNVTADPPFSHLDIISCRNVLIYLATPLQRRILSTFHYALNVPGYLILGSAESVGEHAELFDMADRPNKIYAKKTGTPRSVGIYSTPGLKGMESLSERRFPRREAASGEFQREADRVLLGRYSPPGVLVNESFDVIHYRGTTSAYLVAPPGEPTTNVLKLAREGLFLDLRAALNDAVKGNKVVRRQRVRVRDGGSVRNVSLEVMPIKPSGVGERCFLVLFHETDPSEPAAPVEAPPDESALIVDEQDRDRHVDLLRKELAATKDYLQSLVEQSDAVNEELRAANEEILSSNEELQSTNEELETAKEELQSANEELTTVNEQLQHRNAELYELNNDMTNLMTSTTIPVVMVGGDLRIRRFTAPAKRVMNLLPTDVGRPISDIKPAIEVADLDGIIESVMETVQPQERVARDRDGRWLSLRITPYRTHDNRIDGAVLLLLDVDLQKRAEEALRNADRRKDEFLATLAHELRNPISPLLNAAEIMRLAGDDPVKVAHARDVVYRQVRQLSHIVEDLIDVSRIIEHKIELRRETVTLSSVLDTAIESCLSMVEGRRHHIEVSQPKENITLYADPVRLSQIVINLVNNAAKFTDEGGQIWVSASVLAERRSRVRETPGGIAAPAMPYVVLKVRDSGIGIEPDLQRHVFEMFTQGDRRAGAQAGLGIGLSLVRALVEMHGGDVDVSSDGRGKGTEFIVRIPLNLLSVQRETPPPQLAWNQSAARRRVMIVDDNEDQAHTLAMLMKVLGHETRLAYDGLTAVEEAKSFRPDIALVDIGIPGINGYEVARQIRAMPELAHVILVAQTGWGHEGDRARSHEAGFDHHLVKPIELESLERILAAGPRTADATADHNGHR